MATTLGKRKRRTVELTKDSQRQQREGSESLEESAQEIFRRDFEAQFEPLPVVQKDVFGGNIAQEEESEQSSDWEGISDGEEGVIQVVEHKDAQTRFAAMSKEELKSFMSSKPPTTKLITPLIRDKAGSVVADDDPSEAANLKKDLALQRLLSESHLLDSAANPTLSGNNRHKATDLRLLALGSKKSILRQEKMPIAHRKGITSKQNDREQKRRKEAKENGIILEKAKMGGKKESDGKRHARRDRGVGGPGVGRFSGGTLTLSSKDIFDIQGPRQSPSTRGGRGGRGSRGRKGR